MAKVSRKHEKDKKREKEILKFISERSPRMTSRSVYFSHISRKSTPNYELPDDVNVIYRKKK